MISYRAAVASALGQGNRENGDNFYFNTRYLTADLIDSQVLLSHKKAQKGLQIYAVSDGTGAESYDEETSAIIVKNLLKYHKRLVDDPECDVPNTILDYIDETNKIVNRNIRETGNHDSYGTLALLCVERESTLICSVGDSRVYKFSRGRLQQLTEDHTQAQKMVSLGLLDASKASSHIKRNKLTQFFGEMPEGMSIEPYMDAIVSNDGDMYLLCTKGFYEAVSKEEIAGILSHQSNPADAVDELMAYATDKGVKDDATIILVHAEDTEAGAAIGGAAVGAAAAGASAPMFKSTRTTLFAHDEEKPANDAKKQYEEYTEQKDEGDGVNGFFGMLLAPFRKDGVKDPNKFWPSLIIFAVCILALIVLAVFGYNLFSSNRQNNIEPTKAPAIATATPTVEPTETPAGEITPFAHSPSPTKDPNATPAPTGTPTPVPTASPTPTAAPSATPTKAPATPTPTKAPTPTPAPTVTDLSVSGAKTQYTVGQGFSKDGMKVFAEYTDGSTKNVTNDCSYSGFDSSNPGSCTVTVSFGGKSTSFTVTINPVEP